MSVTPPILDTPDCQNESQQLSEALEECIRTFTQEHQKLKTPKSVYLAKCLELENMAMGDESSLPTSPVELRMICANAMEHGRILGKMRENMPKEQEVFENAHSQAVDRLVDQLFVLLGPLLTQKVMQEQGLSVQCRSSPSPQPEITLGQAIDEDDGKDVHMVPLSDDEGNEVVTPRRKQPRRTKASRAPSRSRTIEFEDVFQDGDPDEKQLIVRYPENHGHFYILHCEHHDTHFNGPNALSTAASHLNQSSHGGKRQGYRAVIREFGVLVLGCSASLASKNNALLGPKSPRIIKRKPSLLIDQDRKRRRASSISSRRRQSSASEITRSMEDEPVATTEPDAIDQPSRANMTPTPPPETVYSSILNPEPGEVYFCLASETRSYVPVLILPMENLEDVGVEGTLSSLGLMDDLPNAVVHNLDTGKLDWAEGYDEKGKYASKRAFPAIYLTSTYFPARCPVAWVAAMNLQEWDLNPHSTVLQMNEHSKVLRSILRQRKNVLPYSQRRRAAQETVADADLPSAVHGQAGQVRPSAPPSATSESPEAMRSRPPSVSGEDKVSIYNTASPLVSHEDREVVEISSDEELVDEIKSGRPLVSHECKQDATETDVPMIPSHEDVSEPIENEFVLNHDTHESSDAALIATEHADAMSLSSAAHSIIADEDLDASMNAALFSDEDIEESLQATLSTNQSAHGATKTSSPPIISKKDTYHKAKPSPSSIPRNDPGEPTTTFNSPSDFLDEGVDNVTDAALLPVVTQKNADDLAETMSFSISHQDTDGLKKTATPTASQEDEDEIMNDAPTSIRSSGDTDDAIETTSSLAIPLEDNQDEAKRPSPRAINHEAIGNTRSSSSPFHEQVNMSDVGTPPSVSDYAIVQHAPTPSSSHEQPAGSVDSSSSQDEKSQSKPALVFPNKDTSELEPSLSTPRNDPSDNKSPSAFHGEAIGRVEYQDSAHEDEMTKQVPPRLPDRDVEDAGMASGQGSASNIHPGSEMDEALKESTYSEGMTANTEPEDSSTDYDRDDSDLPVLHESHNDDDIDWQSLKQIRMDQEQVLKASRQSLMAPSNLSRATSEDPFLSGGEKTPVPEVRPKATKSSCSTSNKPKPLPAAQEIKIPSTQPTPVKTTRTKLPNSRVTPSIADLLSTDSDAPSTLPRPIHDAAGCKSPYRSQANVEPTPPTQDQGHFTPTTASKIVAMNVSPEPEKVDSSGVVYSKSTHHRFASILTDSPSFPAHVSNQSSPNFNAAVVKNNCSPSMQPIAPRGHGMNSSQNGREQSIANSMPVADSMGVAYAQQPSIASHNPYNAESHRGQMQSPPPNSGWHNTTLAPSSIHAQSSPRLLQEDARQALQRINSPAMQSRNLLNQPRQGHVAFQQGLPSPTPQSAGFAQQYSHHHDTSLCLPTPGTTSIATRRESFDYRAPLSPTDSQTQHQSQPASARTSPKPQPMEPYIFSAGPKAKYGGHQPIGEVREVPHQQSSPPIHHQASFTPHNYRGTQRATQRATPRAPFPETNRTRSEAGTRPVRPPSLNNLGQGAGAHDLKWTAVSQAEASAPWLVTPPGGVHEQIRGTKRSGANDYKVNIQSMRSALNTYVCDYCPPRNKKHYQTAGWMKKHLELVHGVAARSMI